MTTSLRHDNHLAIPCLSEQAGIVKGMHKSDASRLEWLGLTGRAETVTSSPCQRGFLDFKLLPRRLVAWTGCERRGPLAHVGKESWVYARGKQVLSRSPVVPSAKSTCTVVGK